MKRSILSAFFCLLLAPSSPAILDTNGNGLSDLWERRFNNDELFPETFDPQADADSDGWTNAEEAAAGTDPFDPNPPDGLVRPATRLTPAVWEDPGGGEEPFIVTPEVITVSWPTLPGKYYTLSASTELTADSWLDIESFTATGGAVQYHFQADNNERLFWRVAVSDVDTDGDGLTDAEERALGSSTYFADTDDDGIPDLAEIAAGSPPAGDGADHDGDGVPDNEIYSVEFEVTEEWHSLGMDVGFLPFTGGTEQKRYLTLTVENEFTIEGSPRYEDTSEGSRTVTRSYLDGNELILPEDNPPSEDAEGLSYAEWVATHATELAEGETLELGTTTTEADEPSITADGSTSVVTLTTPWTIRKSGSDDRTGTEVITLTTRGTLSDAVTYPELWTNHFKDWNWRESPPAVYGPQEIASGHFPYVNDLAEAAVSIREDYLKSNFHIGATLRLCAGSLHNDRSVGGNLKRLRWRWVRFDPLNPFTRVHSPPPSGYEKQFAILLNKTQYAGVSYPSPDVTEASDPQAVGIVAVECTGGSGEWQDANLGDFEDFRITEPEGLTGNTFKAWTGTDVFFENLSLQHVSRDKFLAGTILIPESLHDLELEIIGPGDTSLGKYGELSGGGATTVYSSIDELLGNTTATQPEEQKVWFVRDESDPRRLRWYTCLETTGAVTIRFTRPGNSSAIYEVAHELVEAEEFASIIGYIDRWIKGTLYVGTGSGTTWLTATDHSISGSLANETRAALIPFFDVIDQITGCTPCVMGILDGIQAGYEDDKAFLASLWAAGVTSKNWVYAASKTEVDRWLDNPAERAKELKQLLRDFCSETILPGLSDLGENFTSWQKFRDLSWRAWARFKEADQFARLVTLSSSQLVLDAFVDWGDDFCTRMLEEAEKVEWDNSPWTEWPFIGGDNNYRKLAWYTGGYTFGYLAEQCVAAGVSGGSLVVSKVLLKGGASLAGRLAPRAVAALAVRLHFFKNALQTLNIADDGMRLAYEGAMSSAGREATTPAIKEIPLSAMENRLASEGFQRSTFNFKKWVDAATKDGNIRKLVRTPGKEGQVFRKTSQWVGVMDDKASAEATKGWMAAYERLLKFEGDSFVDDRAEDLLSLMKVGTPEGREAMKKSLEEYGAGGGNGKFWFRDVEKIQDVGFRYSNYDPRFDGGGNLLPGDPKLGVHQDGGWYVGFEKIDASADAISRFQLPPGSSAKYRLEFDWDAVKSNVRIPRGNNGQAEWFEPLCRDYPEFGTGEGGQLLVDGVEVPIKAIWDISGNVPIRLF